MKTCTKCKMRYPNEATFCFVDGLELADLPDPRIGTLLAGRYVLEEVIGEGGMATVYRARQKLVDRLVAVKIMNPMLATDPVVRERFRREARSAQMLAHPNIIEIFDQGDTEDGTCFLVMELLQGVSLGALIERGPLEIDRALHLMIQIARGLARAHDLEVIHRDIKPENIFLCRRDNGSDLVKLLDFGIAKSRHDSRLTGQGELFGTPQYMAPERIMGADTSGSSDLYALGVVFFEMLTGGLPFDANDITAFFAMHINEAPPSLRSRNPRVPQALDELVVKMLAKEPKDRPVDAHRIHQDLQAILHEREAPAPPDASDEPLSVPAPITLGEGPGDPWARRIFVLEQMLARAFGRKDLAPGNLTSLLDDVNELTRRVVTLRNEGFEAQNALEQIDLRGREKRAQLGFAVHQLGVDVSRAKEELRDSSEALTRAEEATQASRARFLEAHKEVLYWEGRSAFAEPWPDLARAYSAAADGVEEWRLLRADERRAQEAIENANRNVSDLDFQIRELRSALAAHERDLDEERAKCRSRIESHGKEADLLETQLYELTTRFCSPLRTRPELQGLFKELEMAAAAA